ncbi:MAG: hypothetical protein KME09_09690 [Pleurocapsa minor HA4230-MV1]|nr:hypothetical protein [Pleurocapsa minor HA4230-MV1]
MNLTSAIALTSQKAFMNRSNIMSLSRVFVDFHNADEQGRLRLNCIGTIEDLARQQAELENGQHLTLYSEDLEVDGVVQFSEDEKVWVATIDWNQIRQVKAFNESTAQRLHFIFKFIS